MAKRIQVTMSDENYNWLATQANENGLAVAAYANMLIAQAKRSMENQADLSAMLRTFSQLPPELIAEEMKKMAKEA